MTIYTVRHITTYHYKEPVGFGEHRMMLAPREDPDQRLLDLNLEIAPQPSDLRWSRDVYDNRMAVAHFSGRAALLRVESVMRVDHSLTDIADANIEDSARSYPFAYAADDLPHLINFIERDCADPDHKVKTWAQSFLRGGASINTRALLVDMTHGIHKGFTYKRRHEKGIQDPLETLNLGSGSCRDLAVLMIDAVRSLGLAARFVSGYLHVRHVGDARGGNTHAWVQAYVPGCGWIDFDPSSGVVGNRGLIRAAVARDPRQAIPLQGVWIGAGGDSLGMKVEVRVSAADAGLDVKEDGRQPLLMPPSRRPVPA
ncbi:MAG TPA: transglutaminase family protein [Steroidobacteraceae bacterium]|jgi:transglutaminase-like putative cysteine protease|nr:transglutaminase family protein [Steroidobacteraceae bacterium]